MSELIAPPDIEAVVLNYLRPLLGVPCVTNVPSSRPASFLVATAVPSNGIVNKALFESLVSLEVWNVDRVSAGALAREAIARLETAPSFYADCGGPGWLPDPDSGTPRYVFTATIFTRTVLL